MAKKRMANHFKVKWGSLSYTWAPIGQQPIVQMKYFLAFDDLKNKVNDMLDVFDDAKNQVFALFRFYRELSA